MFANILHNAIKKKRNKKIKIYDKSITRAIRISLTAFYSLSLQIYQLLNLLIY